jgi:hypothetical protein
LGLVLEDLDFSDMPYLEQLATGLNVPAAFAGGLLASLIEGLSKEQLSGAKLELLSHGFTAIAVPFLWFIVSG